MPDAYVTAFRLLTLGFSVIPSGGGEKHKAPLVNWRDYQTTVPDESQLEAWERELNPALWGIVINDRIAVIDADTPDGWTVRVLGKGSKPGVVAISASIAAELQSYCYRAKIGEGERIFPVSRSQAFRIVTEAFDKSGIPRPSKERDHVGGVHILRHSGAIERLRLTGNPRATQSQLRHKTALMTMRCLKTLTVEESLRIQQGVEDQW